MTPRVVVTGIGAVTSAGLGVGAVLRALRANEDGLRRLRRFVSPRCGDFPVGEVGLESNGESRNVVLARPALFEALSSAGLAAPLGPRAAFVYGTCVGGMPESEETLADALLGRPFDPATYMRHECAATTAALAAAVGVEGPTATVSDACASGAAAISVAAGWLEDGLADVVVAGGGDPLCRLTLNGFASLLATDPEGCRPFDLDRRGMSLGEGAALFVLERAEEALRRGARVRAELLGRSDSCDAFHATAPDPEGRGAEDALRRALALAGLTPASVDYVNAHGTGTRENDRAEGRMLARVFGVAPPPVSSVKRTFGHLLGGAGAIEAVVAVLALECGLVPGTPGFVTPDPECSVVPVAEPYARPLKNVVSNSFGFGGTNVVLVFSRGVHA